MIYEAMLKHKTTVMRDYDAVSQEEREKAERILALCKDKPVRKLTPADFRHAPTSEAPLSLKGASRLRAAKREFGICYACDEPAEEGKTMCKAHQDRKNELNRKYRANH